jgi:hypothetical protein
MLRKWGQRFWNGRRLLSHAGKECGAHLWARQYGTPVVEEVICIPLLLVSGSLKYCMKGYGEETRRLRHRLCEGGSAVQLVDAVLWVQTGARAGLTVGTKRSVCDLRRYSELLH